MADKLKIMHQLIAEERYREAREILETEPDISPDVADKWLKWLEELHLDERRAAGVEALTKKAPQVQQETPLSTGIATTLVVVLAIIAWMAAHHAIATQSMAYKSMFMFIGLVLGVYGWNRTAAKFTPSHHFEAGAAIGLSLFILLISGARVIFVYFPDPPFRFVVLGFLLIYPALAVWGWSLGTWIGTQIEQTRLNQLDKA